MAGRKVFAPATVLTAADVNNFLMDQAVMVFADSAARGSAIPTPTEGMVTYLEDTNLLEVFTGTSFVPVAEEADLTTLIPKSTVTTAGDLIVADGAGSVTRLGIGAADTVLTSDGTTATWEEAGGGGMELLATSSLTGSSVSITSLSQDYSKLIFVGTRILSSVTTTMKCQIGAGTTYWAGSGGNGYSVGSFVDASTNVLGDVKSTNAGNNFYLQMFNYTATDTRPPIFGALSAMGDEDIFNVVGMRFSLGTVNQVTVSLTSGTFTSGTISVYGAN